MKVFRTKLFKESAPTYANMCGDCGDNTSWYLDCDGKEVVNKRLIVGRDGDKEFYVYVRDSWCEEVTDLDCQSDVDAMKDWEIGTEHVIRINGKDKRVVVCSFNISICGGNSCRECALENVCHGDFPCSSYERATTDEVYFEEVAEHKPLVLNLYFSPEHNMTFTEHDVNPDVGFETGKYYRFIGKESDARVSLFGAMNKILEHMVLKCTNGSGCEANFEGIGDMSNNIMYTWMHDVEEKKGFVFWKEMRPLVVAKAPDVITLDEGVNMKWDAIEGTLTCKLPHDWPSVFGAVCGRAEVEPNIKEKPKMKVDKDFTFKKKYTYGTTLHEPKVVKTHKHYANDGACEACGAVITKGSYVLTANEVSGSKWSHDMRTVKTHRLCVDCTAEYIKAKRTPAPYVSYAERQAKWLRDNSVKIGTEVRITRAFDGREDDIDCHWEDSMCSTVGLKGTVTDIDAQSIEVRSDGGSWWYPYFVLEVVKELTYAERQERWLKDNNVKVGTKVKILRSFEKNEGGIRQSWNTAMGAFVGKIGTVKRTDTIFSGDGYEKGIQVDGWWYPYFVLEVVATEPTYEDKFRAWVKENNVKKGDRFVITKGHWEVSNETGCIARSGLYGTKGTIEKVSSGYRCFINAELDDGTPLTVPYYAIKILKEPWFNVGDKVRITIKSSEAYNKIGTVTNVSMHKDGTQTVYMNFAEFWDIKAFNADSKEKIGVLYTPTYEERQAEWIKKHNLKVGDKIAIMRTAKDGEDGWDNSWTESMNRMVGSIYTYNGAYDNGISLLSCGFKWPYFALGVVKE